MWAIRNAKSFDDKLRAMKTLAKMAANKENVSWIGTEEVIESVLREMRSNSVSHYSWGCELLGKLAWNNEIAAMIGEKGGNEVIVSRFRHSASSRDKLRAIRALINLAMNDANAIRIGTDAVIRAVLREMQSDCGLHYALGCELLGILANNHDIAAMIGEKGGIEVIVSGIRKTASSEDKLRVIWALANLAMDEDNAKKIGTERIIVALLREMQSDAALHSDGCLMLEILARNTDTAAMIGEKGGIEVIVSGFRNSVSTDASMRVIRALANLAANDENTKRLGTDEVIETVLNEMRNDPDLDSFAISLLGNLALNDKIAAMIGKKGGIEVIVSGLRNYDSSRDKSIVVRALANLSRNDDNRNKIGTEEVIEAVVGEMQNDPEIHSDGCILIWNLAWDHNIAAIIGAKGGIEVVLDGLRNTVLSDDKLRIIRALSFLAINQENAKIIATEEVFETVLSEMQAESTLHFLWGCVMFGNLALNDEIAGMIGAIGGIDVIVSGFLNFSSSDDKLIVIRALANLAENDENARRIWSADFIDAMVCELRNDSILHSDGCDLLRILGQKIYISTLICEEGEALSVRMT